MSVTQTDPQPKTAKPAKQCLCKIGASGQEGVGSSPEFVENPRVICDRTTGKSFAQGHDAALASRLAQEVADGITTIEDAIELVKTAGGSAALVAKTRHSAKLRVERAEAKAKKAADKAKPEADTQE
jgi:hypothetical protein